MSVPSFLPLAAALIRLAQRRECPYPFIDVDALGAAMVTRSAIGIGALFPVAGFVIVVVDRVLDARCPEIS